MLTGHAGQPLRYTPHDFRRMSKHFELRKVELGTCGRPYGTPCAHEHASVRCPMLRVEPRQQARLVEIAHNLTALGMPIIPG